jgi:RNA-directed DNA polymerase
MPTNALAIEFCQRSSVDPALRADDFVVLLEREQDAQAFYARLGTRLGKFGLEISAEKTRIVRFDRRRREGQFEFLGFAFRWQRNRRGKTVLARVTARRKLRGALQRFRAWIREKYHTRLPPLLREYAAKLRGHYQYYGLRGNGHRLYSYYRQTYRALYQWLNRRSQKRSYDWPSSERLLRRHHILAPRLMTARPQQLCLA